MSFGSNFPNDVKSEPREEEPERPSERQALRAAFYALYLRDVEGLAADEARVLVKQRYPRVRLPEISRRLKEEQP